MNIAVASMQTPLLRSRPTCLRGVKRGLPFLLGGLLPVFLCTPPALAAERLYVSYGLLERSISLSALRTYAETGAIEDDDLFVYLQYVKDPKILQELRKGLNTPADLSSVAVSQFLYTPQGIVLLRRLGQVIQPESRDKDAAFFAIRAALILAADDKKRGLSPLNVLEKFPTRGLRIDIFRSLEIARDLEQLVNTTNKRTVAINQQALQAAAANPLPGSTIPDLISRGPLSWQKESINLIDRSRVLGLAAGQQRIFPADIYFPQLSRDKSQPGRVPVVVISHGLGSDRSTFAYLAEHLASHGFIVAVPEHPGSNSQQTQALLTGTVSEVAEPTEFIDRPLDVKFLLDELGRKALTDARYAQMNLQQVGVLGQSFGGYTTLALAGAPINFAQLKQDCPVEKLENTLNISLLLQCRAEVLPQKPYQLNDARVKAIIAINPIASIVLGQAGLSQIQIPTMMVSGDADTVSPALPEQIIPFSWLQNRDRYLVMVNRGTHFSTLAEAQNGNDPLQLPPEVIGENPGNARRYMNALSLAFFSTYIANQPSYRPYLSAAYGNAITQAPMNLSVLTTLNP
jgi:predicted dienelactone hydrolase